MNSIQSLGLAQLGTDELVTLMFACAGSEDQTDKQLGAEVLSLVTKRKPESMSLNEFISSQPSVRAVVQKVLDSK